MLYEVITDWLRQALAAYRVGGEPWIADISPLDAANRELVNQILGEGEVSLKYTDTVKVSMQESVLAGIWRTFYLDEAGCIRITSYNVCYTKLLRGYNRSPYAAGP